MRQNSVSATMHVHDPKPINVRALYGPETAHITPDPDTIHVNLGGAGSLILSIAAAAALSVQLNEYLARFAREKDLAAAKSISDLGGFQ